MNCHNCKNSLNGDEDFCPRCGVPQRFTDTDSTKKEKTEAAVKDSSIFHSEPVYIYTDAPPKEIANKKPKFTILLVSTFIITVLGIGAVTLGQYLKLTPVFSELFTSQTTAESTSAKGTSEAEFDSSIGTVQPDISLKSTPCTVTSEKGLPLRKGPDSSYAQTELLEKDTLLQVTGKSLQDDTWVYVYVSSLDVYGWVSGSYITRSASAEEPDITQEAKADNKTE